MSPWHEEALHKKKKYGKRLGHLPIKFDSGQKRQWLLSTRNELNENLTTKCLLSSIALAYHHSKYLNGEDVATYPLIKRHNSSTEAAKELARIIDCLMVEMNLSNENCQQAEIVMERASEHLDSSICLLGEKRGEIILISPRGKKDFTKRPLYLLQSYLPNEQEDHVDVIISKRMLMGQIGMECTECGQFVKNSHGRHFCKKQDSCLACRRVKMKPEYFTCQREEREFCDADIVAEKKMSTCPFCNIKLVSDSCRMVHGTGRKKDCNGLGWLCLTCNSYISSSTGFQSKSAIAKNHSCGEKSRICKQCGTGISRAEKTPLHQCPLIKIESPKKYCRHAFVYTLFQDNDTEKDKMISQSAVGHCLIYETSRTIFRRVLFFRDGEITLDEEDISLNYLPQVTNEAFSKALKNIALETDAKSKTRSLTMEKCSRLASSEGSATAGLLMFVVRTLKGPFSLLCDSQNSLFSILHGFINSSIHVNVIGDSNYLYGITVPNIDLTCLTKCNYLPGSLACLQKMYDINYIQYNFFPTKVPKEGWPSRSDYRPNFMEPEERKKFDIFWSTSTPEGRKTDKSYMATVLKNRGLILAQGMALYMKDLLRLQRILDSGMARYAPEEVQKASFLPFSSNIMTSASLSHALVRKYVFNPRSDLKACGIDEARGIYSFRASKKEMLFVLWKANQFPDREIHSAYTTYSQKRLPYLFPDIYVEEETSCNPTKAGYLAFFQGCMWHGHAVLDPTCTQCPEGGTNPATGETYLDIVSRDRKKMDLFIEFMKGRNFVIEVVWECEFDKMRKTNEGLKEFLRNPEIRETTRRLAPRDISLGGRVETFTLKYDERESSTGFCAVDSRSNYPGTLRTLPIPTGSGFVVLDKIADLKFSPDSTELWFQQRKVEGYIQASVLLDRSAKIPFVSVEDHSPTDYERDGQSWIYSNCRACSNQRKQDGVCRHRALRHFMVTKTFTVPEILYIKNHTNITIQAFWEAYLYYDSHQIFLPYLSLLCREKVRYSEHPNEDEKSLSDYLDILNSTLEPAPPLTEDDMKPNPQFRALIKNLLSSLYGRVAGVKSRPETIIVNTKDALRKIVSERQVEAINVLNPDTVQVTVAAGKRKRNSRKSYFIAASYCVTVSRICMHRTMMRILENGYSLAYHDSDSIFVHASLREMRELLRFSEAPLDYGSITKKNERISQYRCLGPRKYVLEISQGSEKKKGNEVTRVVIKAAGLSLACRSPLDLDLYDGLLNSWSQSSEKEKEVQILRKAPRKNIMSEHEYHLTGYKVRNSIRLTRACKKENNPLLETVPFGYKK